MGIRNRLTADVTVLSNRFIDEYMKDANGEYVKVYLYFVRHEGEIVTIEQAADALDSTLTDVRRAVEYWRKAGVFSDVRPAEEAPETGEAIPAGPAAEIPAKAPEEIPAQAPAESTAAGVREPEAPDITVDMTALANDMEFQQLIYIAQQYMRVPLSNKDTEILASLYQVRGMSEDLLEYLIEYCVQNGHSSMRYAEKVALNWLACGITTVEQAKKSSGTYTGRTYAVMRAMGLGQRNPGAVELGYINRWFDEYGFSKDIVIEACDRTIGRIHQPNFKYADGILRDWQKSGVRTMKDIAEDDRRKAGSDSRSRRGPAKPGAQNGGRATRFDNFDGHGYDYEKLLFGAGAEKDGGKTGGGDGTQ